MFKEALIALCVGFAAATTCESVDGMWFFTLDTFVVNYAHGGEELNPRYNCFEFSKDNVAVQKFRVDLKNPLIFNVTEAKQHTSQLANLQLTGVSANNGDRNAKLCIDGQLRSEIAEAVKDAEDSCQGLVNALASKLNRPGWVMNCVNRSPRGYAVGFFFNDDHFCRYDVIKGGKVYSLNLVKLDKS